MAEFDIRHTKADPVLHTLLTAPITQILEDCMIPSWDVLIIGDGSGSKVDNPCGWSAVLVDRETSARRLFGGHTNAGSTNFAECMPLIQAMSWYDHYYGQTRGSYANSFFNVHIITDSQSVQQAGENASRKGKHSGPLAFLTAYIVQMQTKQYRFYWHWRPRNQYALTDLVDTQSKSHRITSNDGLAELAAEQSKPRNTRAIDSSTKNINDQPEPVWLNAKERIRRKGLREPGTI